MPTLGKTEKEAKARGSVFCILVLANQGSGLEPTLADGPSARIIACHGSRAMQPTGDESMPQVSRFAGCGDLWAEVGLL